MSKKYYENIMNIKSYLKEGDGQGERGEDVALFYR